MGTWIDILDAWIRILGVWIEWRLLGLILGEEVWVRAWRPPGLVLRTHQYLIHRKDRRLGMRRRDLSIDADARVIIPRSPQTGRVFTRVRTRNQQRRTSPTATCACRNIQRTTAVASRSSRPSPTRCGSSPERRRPAIPRTRPPATAKRVTNHDRGKPCG